MTNLLHVSPLATKKFRAGGINTPHGELKVDIIHNTETKYITNQKHYTVYTWKHGDEIIYIGKTAQPLNIRTSKAIYAFNNDGREGFRRKEYFRSLSKEDFLKGDITVEAHAIYFRKELAEEVESYLIQKYIRKGQCKTNSRI